MTAGLLAALPGTVGYGFGSVLQIYTEKVRSARRYGTGDSHLVPGLA